MERYRDEFIEALKPIEELIQQVNDGGEIPPISNSNQGNVGVSLKFHTRPQKAKAIDYSKEDH